MSLGRLPELLDGVFVAAVMPLLTCRARPNGPGVAQ
jgi:hypothetical protein